MERLLHLWNNNVKKLPLRLLLNYKANSLLKILQMRWVLIIHDIGYNQNVKKGSMFI
jgi:hypothetical protein